MGLFSMTDRREDLYWVCNLRPEGFFVWVGGGELYSDFLLRKDFVVLSQGAHNLAEHDRERINKGTKRMSSLPLPSLVISFILRDIYCMGKLLPTNPA